MCLQHAMSKAYAMAAMQSSIPLVSPGSAPSSSAFHQNHHTQASTVSKSIKRKKSVDKSANERNKSRALLRSFDHSMVKALLSSLHAWALRSDNINKRFDPSAFQRAAMAVRKVTPEERKYLCTPLRMKIEYQHLRRDYQVFQTYRSQDGLSTDQRGVVTGEAGTINAYMEAHPEAAKFRDSTLAFEKELGDLFDVMSNKTTTYNRRQVRPEAFDSIETDGDVSPANKSIVISNMRRRGALAKIRQAGGIAHTYVETQIETDSSSDSGSSTAESLANETLEAIRTTATRVLESILARQTDYRASSVARATEVLSSDRIDLSEEDNNLAAIILTDTANAEIFLGVPREHQQAMLQHFIVEEREKRRMVR
ncbi:hypothetical protein KC360_g7884 [Hortaea werneckii]|nr:hypothetical protein KC361_g8184 [Hortaea werneckii]KAI6879558.1 hypothetical protein KC325_g7875 [Hortaea werneckii]KAI6987598.1 hypothetical protein KC359_g8197 [Hortaea werneckii]KAI7141674.1 hypothetical protein KC344_g7815 [Hortaea werneckii]KAI7168753.1 hypothetical protein KC360_g7884 [Hortaea werneckii]